MDITFLIIIAVVNFILGFFVLLKDPKNKINLSFSLLTFAISFWVITWAVEFIVQDPESKLFWARMMLAGPAIIPTAFLYFAFVFPKAEVKINKLAILIGFVLPSLVLLVFIPTEYYVKAIKMASWGLDFTPGVGYAANMVVSAIYFVFGFVILAGKFLRYKGMDRERIKYLFLGMITASVIGILVNFVLPLAGITRFNKLGPMSTIAMVAFASYAIVKHRLMDFSIIISRTLAEFMAIAFHVLIYLALVFTYLQFFPMQISPLFISLTVVYGVIVGQTHQRLRLYFQTSAEKLFLKGRYDYYKTLADASSRVGEKLSLTNILNLLYETFSGVMEISRPRVFLPEYFADPEKNSKRYVVFSENDYFHHGNDEIAFDSPIVSNLIKSGEPLADIKELKAALVVPCLLEGRLIAIFVLGQKLSEDIYTDEDVRLLKVLANQVAVALDHTHSYEKIKNDLEMAERQLGRSQRLASLGTLTAGVTHEIRNPLTVIRAETERLTNQPRDVEYLNNFRDLLLKHIDRITGIVQRMLSLAKEKDKRSIDVDLNDIINTTAQFFTVPGINIDKNLQTIPTIKGDPEELQEVFVNLIQNAIDAMPKGGRITVRSFQDGPRTVIEVTDTGKGIAQEIREKIFDPFYSTRHEGVGLGLSIVYRIVREHGGDIKVDSELGRGTTFRLLF